MAKNEFARILEHGVWLVACAIVIGTIGAVVEAGLISAGMFAGAGPGVLALCGSSVPLAVMALIAHVIPLQRAFSVDLSTILWAN